MDNTFREQFRNASPQQLVDALNREVGNAGWVTARGFYLTALREAFLATGLDCSGFINDGGMRLTTVRLDGDTVVPLADAPTPPDAPELPAAGSAGDLDDQSLVDALIRSMAWGHDARVREFGERLCVVWPGARGEGEDGSCGYFAEFEDVDDLIAWLPDDLPPARVAALEDESALTDQEIALVTDAVAERGFDADGENDAWDIAQIQSSTGIEAYVAANHLRVLVGGHRAHVHRRVPVARGGEAGAEAAWLSRRG